MAAIITVNYADTIPGFNNNDRLGLTTFGSVLLHVVIVLGIGFTAPQILPKTNPLQTLDITLVNTRSDLTPDNPDYLAQVNQEGGGDTDKVQIARSPLPANPTPSQSQKLPQAKLAARIETSLTKPVPEYFTEQQAVQQVVTTQPEPEPVRRRQDENKLGVVNMSELDQERQRLSAEISEAWQDYLKDIKSRTDRQSALSQGSQAKTAARQCRPRRTNQSYGNDIGYRCQKVFGTQNLG